MSRIKSFLNALNGWQRLFAVYVVFIHIPFAAMIFPAIAVDPVEGADVLAELNNQDLPRAKDGSLGFRVYNLSEAAYLRTDKGDMTVNEAVEKMVQIGSYEKVLVSPKNGPNYMVVFPKELPEADKRKVAKMVYERVDKHWWTGYVQKVALLIGGAIGTAALLYIFGMAIGWIFRGFFKREAQS